MSYDSPLHVENKLYRHIAKEALPGVIAAWGKCVKHNIRQQLEIGIRYFDFRFALSEVKS